jgi:hypothetical protein
MAKREKTHQKIIEKLWKNKEILRKALNLEKIWIRGKEFKVSNLSNEKADLVFQDGYNPNSLLEKFNCYVLELKKGKGDHEIIGQLKKYKTALQRGSYGGFKEIIGIALANEYTKSGKEMLLEDGNRVFVYSFIDDELKISEVK